MKRRRLLIIFLSGILLVGCMIAIKSNMKQERQFDTIKLEKEPDGIYSYCASENLAIVTDGQLAVYNETGKVRPIETEFKIVFAAICNESIWVIDDRKNLYEIDYRFAGEVSISDVILEHVVSVYCTDYCQCAVDEEGQLYVWGENDNGRLGMPGEVIKKPTLVPYVSHVKKVIFGNDRTILLMEDGSIYEAGVYTQPMDEEGEINYTEFTKNDLFVDIIDIFGGVEIFGVCQDGSVLRWWSYFKENDYIASSCEREGITIFCEGYHHWLGMNDKGDVYYWGLDILKEPDCKCLPTVSYPTKIPEIKDAEMIYSGGSVGYVKKGLEIIILSK